MYVDACLLVHKQRKQKWREMLQYKFNKLDNGKKCRTATLSNKFHFASHLFLCRHEN